MKNPSNDTSQAINQAILSSHEFSLNSPKYPYLDKVKVPTEMVEKADSKGDIDKGVCTEFIGVRKSKKTTCTGNAFKEYDMFKQLQKYEENKAAGIANPDRKITIQCKPEFGNITLDAEDLKKSRESFRVYVNEDRHILPNSSFQYDDKMLNWHLENSDPKQAEIQRRIGSGNIHVHETIGFLDRSPDADGNWKPSAKPFNFPVVTISMPNASRISENDITFPESPAGIDLLLNNYRDGAVKNIKRVADVSSLEKLEALCVPPIGLGAFGGFYKDKGVGELSHAGVSRSSLKSLIDRFSELKKQGASVPDLIISSGYFQMAKINTDTNSAEYKEFVGDMAEKITVTSKDLIEVTSKLNQGGKRTALLNGGNQYGTDMINGHNVVGNRYAKNESMGLTDEDCASATTLRMSSPKNPYKRKEIEEYVGLVRGRVLDLKTEIEKQNLKFESFTQMHMGLDNIGSAGARLARERMRKEEVGVTTGVATAAAGVAAGVAAAGVATASVAADQSNSAGQNANAAVGNSAGANRNVDESLRPPTPSYQEVIANPNQYGSNSPNFRLYSQQQRQQQRKEPYREDRIYDGSTVTLQNMIDFFNGKKILKDIFNDHDSTDKVINDYRSVTMLRYLSPSGECANDESKFRNSNFIKKILPSSTPLPNENNALVFSIKPFAELNNSPENIVGGTMYARQEDWIARMQHNIAKTNSRYCDRTGLSCGRDNTFSKNEAKRQENLSAFVDENTFESLQYSILSVASFCESKGHLKSMADSIEQFALLSGAMPHKKTRNSNADIESFNPEKAEILVDAAIQKVEDHRNAIMNYYRDQESILSRARNIQAYVNNKNRNRDTRYREPLDAQKEWHLYNDTLMQKVAVMQEAIERLNAIKFDILKGKEHMAKISQNAANSMVPPAAVAPQVAEAVAVGATVAALEAEKNIAAEKQRKKEALEAQALKDQIENEKERLAAEKEEQQRKEKERLAAEKEEQQRKEKERLAKAEKAEQDRKAKEEAAKQAEPTKPAKQAEPERDRSAAVDPNQGKATAQKQNLKFVDMQYRISGNYKDVTIGDNNPENHLYLDRVTDVAASKTINERHNASILFDKNKPKSGIVVEHKAGDQSFNSKEALSQRVLSGVYDSIITASARSRLEMDKCLKVIRFAEENDGFSNLQGKALERRKAEFGNYDSRAVLFSAGLQRNLAKMGIQSTNTLNVGARSKRVCMIMDSTGKSDSEIIKDLEERKRQGVARPSISRM